MDKAVTIIASGPTAKPVLLCLSDKGQLDRWIENLSTLNAFVVVEAHDLATAVELTQACRPELLLLGQGQGLRSDWDCRIRIAEPMLGSLPVVMIEVHDDRTPSAPLPSVEDVLRLDLAAAEAAIRLRAVLRRERPTALAARVIWNGLELRHDERRVLVGGQPVHLSAQEFNLLALLLEEPQRIWSRQELKRAVWGIRARVGVPALNVLVQKLRRHLAKQLEHDCIEAVRGTGYRLT